MYIAELKGKFSPREERKEDILTSNVFSFFKYADRKLFFYQFLKLIDIHADIKDLITAEFIFWPNYEDGTQPDLVIIIGNHYLLFEAKLFSGFGNNADSERFQMTREFTSGSQEARNLKKNFRLIAITAHYSKHHFISDLFGEIHFDFQWISWHQISLLIHNILNSNECMQIENKSLAEDLYNLMVKKKLRAYAGQNAFDQSKKLFFYPENLFFNASSAIYRGDFLGFSNVFIDIPQIKYQENPIFYQNRLPSFWKLQKFKLLNLPSTIFFGKG